MTGMSVTFSVVATGTPSPSYQWWKGSVAVSGATTDTLALSNVQSANAGSYTVVVSNSAGAVTSNAAVLTVTPASGPPVITTQPANQTVGVGSSVSLSVSATGAAPLNYQWRANGAPLTGATSATLRLSSVQISDAGSYSVVITNSAGSVTSDTAMLTVDAASITVASRPFSSDHLTNAARGTVTGVLVYGGQGTATDTSWTEKIVLLDRGTGTFYTKVHNVQLSGGLACVIANNVSGNVSGTLGEGNSSTIPAITVSLEDGAVLRTLVNSTVTVSTVLIGATPAITAHPQTQTVCAGGVVMFSATAAGAGPLSYQWQLNGANITGATSPTLSIASGQPCAMGDYTVVVSNSTGSVTSNAACLSLVPGRLINLSILTPIAAGDPLTVGAVIGGKGVSGPLPLLIRGVGPSLTPLGVSGALADPKLEVYSGSRIVANNDNWNGTAELSAFAATVGAFPFSSATSKDAALSFGPNIATPPAAYTVQLSGVGTAAGSALAEVYDGFPSGLITATTPRLINMSVLKQIPTASALTAGFVVGGTTPKQVLVRAIGPALGLAPFNVGGVMPDPKLTLFDLKSNAIATNDDWGGDATLSTAFAGAGAFPLPKTSRDAALLITLSPGSYTAQIAASTAAGAAQGGLALVELYDMEGGAAPVVSNQPTNVTTITGATAMFSASAAGAVGYQWQRLPVGSSSWINLSEGNGFFGTTTSGLLANASATQNGDQFRVVVSNSSGVTRSNPASLKVTAAPTSITVTGFVAPTVQPMSLITVGATGLIPDATTYVEFSNSAGALVAQVPAVEVTATSVTVAVPPLMGSDGTSLVGGTLSARIVQLVGGGTLASDSLTAAQLQATPSSKAQAGALALGLLQAELDESKDILATLPGSAYDTASVRAVLNSTIQSLQNSIGDIQRAMTSGSATFTVGSGAGTPVTLTQRELQALDNFLLAGLQAIATSANTQSASHSAGHAVAAAPGPAQTSAAAVVQDCRNGSSNDVILSGLKAFTKDLRNSPTSGPAISILAGLGLGAVSMALGPPAVLTGGSVAALTVTGLALGAGIKAFQIWMAGDGLTQAPSSVANPPSAQLSPRAVALWHRVLQSIEKQSNPSSAATNVLSDMLSPGVSGLAGRIPNPRDPEGGFLRLGIVTRHGASGIAVPDPEGRLYGLPSADSAHFGQPAPNPSDPNEKLTFDEHAPLYFLFTEEFTLSATAFGNSVFAGWSVHAPYLDYLYADSLSHARYQYAGNDTMLMNWPMVKDGLFFIASFDFAYELKVDSSSGGKVDPPSPAAVVYSSGTGLTRPSYLHGTQVKLMARADPGYVFSGWSDPLLGNNPNPTLTITGNKTLTANFTASAPVTYALTIRNDGGNGTGKVTKNPDKTSYTAGETVGLTGEGTNGATFGKWTDTTTVGNPVELGTANPIDITMDRNKTITAAFNPAVSNSSQFDGWYLGSTKSVAGLVTITGGSLYLTIKDGQFVSVQDALTHSSLPRQPGDSGTFDGSISANGDIQLTTHSLASESYYANMAATQVYTGRITISSSGAATASGNYTLTVTQPTARGGSSTWSAARYP